jgi:peptidylprolyl isomerase
LFEETQLREHSQRAPAGAGISPVPITTEVSGGEPQSHPVRFLLKISTVKALVLTIAVCAGLAAAGCGGSDSTAGSNEASGASAETVSAKVEAAAEAEAAAREKPAVNSPETAVPKNVEVTEWESGTGAEAKAGDEVTVRYVGIGYRTDKEFDSSWSRGEPFTFTLGAGEVIPGWEQGVEGMKVGGRRELIVPAKFAYGKAGSPPKVAPNEPLIFVIDLLEVN